MAGSPRPASGCSRRWTAADRLVFLGDLVELRERPVVGILDRVRPFFASAAEQARRQAGHVVPGQPRPRARGAVPPAGAARRRLGRPRLATWPVEPGDGSPDACEVAAGHRARASPTPVSAARGRLRHPRPLPRHAPDGPAPGDAGSASAWRSSRRATATRVRWTDYEAVLAPLYAFAPRSAPRARRPRPRPDRCRASVWRRATDPDGAGRSPASSIGRRDHPRRRGRAQPAGPRPVQPGYQRRGAPPLRAARRWPRWSSGWAWRPTT